MKINLKLLLGVVYGIQILILLSILDLMPKFLVLVEMVVTVDGIVIMEDKLFPQIILV